MRRTLTATEQTMPSKFNYHRRKLLTQMVAAFASAQLGITPARAQSGRSPNSTTLFNTEPLWGLKQVEAGVLNVGYAEMGPSDRPVILLLHGWPYAINSFAEVAPLL